MLTLRTIRLILVTLCVFAVGCTTGPKPGGYRRASVTDKEVRTAAAFAINAQSEAMRRLDDRQPGQLLLLKILRAEQQMVAGMNYRLTLRVRQGRSERTAETIVWRQPWRPNPYQVTSWNWRS